jgi:transcription elongation factor GreB
MATSRPVELRSGYITPEGEKRLRDELAHLWNVERPKVTLGVANAAAEGDRSENAEYIYGKKRLREIDRRIRFLMKRLDELTVVVPSDGRRNEGKVYFGAWMRLEDDEGEQSVYRIVGPDEFDPGKSWISMDSPMGKAAIGKSEGDELIVRRPKGTATFTVVEVSYEPITARPTGGA